MKWSKANTITAVLLAGIALYQPAYYMVNQVHSAMTFDFGEAVAFAMTTRERHAHEDLRNKETRLWHLEDRHKVKPDDTIMRQIIQLRIDIETIKKDLGIN